VVYTEASTRLSFSSRFLAQKRLLKKAAGGNVNQAESKVGRTVFARLDENEDALNAIKQRAEQNKISAGFFFLIGTLKRAVVGFYKDRNYKPIRINGPLEIVCCAGNVSSRKDGELVVHAHIAVANEQGATFGGHLLQGCPIDVTGELVLVETPDAKLKRALRETLNLYLWSFE